MIVYTYDNGKYLAVHADYVVGLGYYMCVGSSSDSFTKLLAYHLAVREMFDLLYLYSFKNAGWEI
jgi:hypothetical protein